MKKFCLLCFLFAPFLLAAQEGGIVVKAAVPASPGPDYALMRDVSGTGARRERVPDGAARAGETFFLDVTIQNTGRDTVRGLRAELKSADSRIGRYIFLERDEVSAGDLEAGASVSLTGAVLLNSDGLDRAFRFSLDRLCPAIPLTFEIVFSDSSGKTWASSLTVPVREAADTESASVGLFSFHVTNRIVEKKSDLEMGLGWDYGASRFSGDIVYNRSVSSATSLHWELKDSLSAYEGVTHEVYFSPLRYDFLRAPSYRAWVGAGGYYHDESADYKGFFDYPDLTAWSVPTLNHFTSGIAYRVAGPRLDFGFTWRGSEWFKASLSGGVIPLYGVWIEENVNYTPLMNEPFSGSLSGSGGPNLHFDLSGIISLPALFSRGAGGGVSPSDWKVWYSMFLYTWSLPNETVQPWFTNEEGWHWLTEKVKMVTLDFTLEAALLVPIGGIHLHLGGGRVFSSTSLDGKSQGSEGKNFINISGRILKF